MFILLCIFHFILCNSIFYLISFIYNGILFKKQFYLTLWPFLPGAVHLSIPFRPRKYSRKHMMVGGTYSFVTFSISESEIAKSKSIFFPLLPEFINCLLSHGRGAAFFVEPNSGMLGPFETQTINITAFTNMWGNYQDNLICKVCHKTIKLLISL